MGAFFDFRRKNERPAGSRRALLGPSFTWCRFGESFAARDPVGLPRDGPADRGAACWMRWPGLPAVLWPCAGGAPAACACRLTCRGNAPNAGVAFVVRDAMMR
jgi:hypothetical protein